MMQMLAKSDSRVRLGARPRAARPARGTSRLYPVACQSSCWRVMAVEVEKAYQILAICRSRRIASALLSGRPRPGPRSGRPEPGDAILRQPHRRRRSVKITRIETFLVHAEHRNLVFVRVQTDE